MSHLRIRYGQGTTICLPFQNRVARALVRSAKLITSAIILLLFFRMNSMQTSCESLMGLVGCQSAGGRRWPYLCNRSLIQLAMT